MLAIFCSSKMLRKRGARCLQKNLKQIRSFFNRFKKLFKKRERNLLEIEENKSDQQWSVSFFMLPDEFKCLCSSCNQYQFLKCNQSYISQRPIDDSIQICFSWHLFLVTAASAIHFRHLLAIFMHDVTIKLKQPADCRIAWH